MAGCCITTIDIGLYRNIGVIEGFLHFNFKPVGGSRYHGNPIKSRHNWVQVSAGTRVMICQILIFLEVTAISDMNQKQIDTGKYALGHFVNQNVFGGYTNRIVIWRTASQSLY